MPIEVRVVTEETYKKWLEAIKQDEEKGKAVLRQAAKEAKTNKLAAVKASGLSR